MTTTHNSLAERLGRGSGLYGSAPAEATTPAEAPAVAAEPKPNFRTGTKPVVPAGRKPNAYKGNCAKCGVFVEAQAGLLGDKVDGKWTVEHIVCPEKIEVPEAAHEALREDPPAQVRVNRPVIRVSKPIHDGTYTIVFEDGDYRTLKVETQSEHDEFKPGQQLVAYLSGRDNESDFTRCGEINDRGYLNVWKKHLDNEQLVEACRVLVADPLAAAKAYGLKSEHCGMCNHKLSTPESLERGIGPDC